MVCLSVGSTALTKTATEFLGRTSSCVLSLLQREAAVAPHHRLLFLSFVDVDDSNTVSFEEFALALKRAEDDFVLKEVCVWTRHHMAPRRTGFSTVLLVCDAQTLRSPLVLTSVLDGCLF